jgi:hypothetical protein
MTAHIVAGKDKFLCQLFHEPQALEPFIRNSNSPDEKYLFCIAIITMLAIVTATNITMRKMSIFLDP